MSIQTTLAEAGENLAQLCDRVVSDREIAIITRQNGEDVALISADELASLIETAHLLSSPTNAARLLTALQRAKSRTLEPQSVEDLRQEIGLGEEA